MRHTIDEAASLVGRTRRSIYRAMTEGRLAYGIEADGRRYIDTAELLRVYGPFEPASQSVTPKMSHGVTVPDDLGEIIARAVAEAVEPLRKEIEQLRETLLLLEHKPADHRVEAPITPNQGSEPEAGQNKRKKAENFADLLSVLDGN